mmetsp:Transcript_12303/g.18880  ORF Transcript_12303/g.18880 Transcript_12303/m.18880 type:complete len:441 (-) Transcript_12303:109-1431(-)
MKSSKASSTASPTASSSCPKQILNKILQNLYEYDILSIQEAKSAQQKVWIVQFQIKPDIASSLSQSTNHDGKAWKEFLQSGENRLVVRQWRGGCRWWNLHRNQDPKILAKAEAFGYRFARQSLTETSRAQKKSPSVVIPRILYFNTKESDGDEFPWAVLEYVGINSTCFDGDYLYDDSYLTRMIKTRHEFGFDEPHPRWGRVPVEHSLEYSTRILEQVLIPLHTNSKGVCSNTEAQTYESMLQLYEQAWKDMKKQERMLFESLVRDQDEPVAKDARMVEAFDLLESAVITVLSQNISTIPPLPPALVHLDLQPQNLLFSRDGNSNIRVSSVLDWEEAAVADPRFDLLLIGRKVCANREQAEEVWKVYSDTTNQNLGLLLPWLQLETIHSITTLLLQSMNLLNGGRNPWETKKDLWEKLRREFVRWEGLCQELEANERTNS